MVRCEHGVVSLISGGCPECALEQELAELTEAAEVLREERDEAWSVAESRTKQVAQMVSLQEEQRRRHFQAMRKKQQEVDDARFCACRLYDLLDPFQPNAALEQILKEFPWLREKS